VAYPLRLGFAKVGYSSPCRVALWPRNFQLFADGPHGPFFDFPMARDAGNLVPGAPGLILKPGLFTFQNVSAFESNSEFFLSRYPAPLTRLTDS